MPAGLTQQPAQLAIEPGSTNAAWAAKIPDVTGGNPACSLLNIACDCKKEINMRSTTTFVSVFGGDESNAWPSSGAAPHSAEAVQVKLMSMHIAMIATIDGSE
jgi:hypothetical protein